MAMALYKYYRDRIDNRTLPDLWYESGIKLQMADLVLTRKRLSGIISLEHLNIERFGICVHLKIYPIYQHVRKFLFSKIYTES